jgi:tRNA(Ile2) C34 agmatinyltransferase TiaS
MSAGHPLIAFEVAITHQDDLLQQAEEQRTVAIADATRRPFVYGFRGRVGHALVGLGERLQSTQQRPRASDLASATGALRISR